jgi:hypothetical protein
MPKALQLTLAAVSAVVFGPFNAALASSVTNADIARKTICWSNGAISAFHKDGTYDCNRCGHGTWRLEGDTLTENGDAGPVVWKITKVGRTLHESLQTAPYEVHWTYCK